MVMTAMDAFAPWARADLFKQGDASPSVSGYTEVGMNTSGTFLISTDTTIPDGFTLYQTGSTFTTLAQTYLGYNAGAVGTIDVTGSGARWATSGYAYLGNVAGSTGIGVASFEWTGERGASAP